MRRFRFLILIFVLLLSFSCGSRKENAALQKIRQLEYNRNAGSPDFLTYLNSKNEKIRKAAVIALGRIQDSSMVIPLSNRLKDEEPEIRAEAAFAIGQIQSKNSENVLLARLDSEPDNRVKANILEALGKRGTVKSFSVIRFYSQSKEPLLAEKADIANGILAYRENPPFNNVAPLIRTLSESQNSRERWRAAYALFRIQNPRSFEAEFQFLSDPDPFVRNFLLKGIQTQLQNLNNPTLRDLKKHEAFRKIQSLSESRPFKLQLRKLLQDSVWYVRIAAAQTIAQLKNRSFTDDLIKLLNDPHPYVQMAAINILAALDGKKAEAALESDVRTASDWHIWGSALVALSGLNSSKALNFVKERIAKSEWPKNYYLIKSLEAIPDKESLRLLENLADSSISAQNSAALEALVNKKNPPVDFLLSRLNQPDPAAITIISSFLSFKKDPRALQPLISVYREFEAPRDMETIQAILAAIDSLRSREAIPFFREQLQNAFPPVRKMAVRALKRLKVAAEELAPTASGNLLRWDFPEIDPSSHPKVLIKTSRGNFTIELFPDKAPVNVANFIYLVKKKYFDGLYFHRVVPGFVVQGGDPRGDGWGGPGYSIPCEYNDLLYERGVVGMALAGKDTGGSQFFITQLPQPHLDGRYTAFGKVVSGMDVVDRLMIYDKIEQATLLN